MPFFRKPSEREAVPTMTVNGRPQPQPEEPGTIQRRFRMFVECERRLAEHPLATADAAGRPVGDGQGLEELVARIRPLFDREASLIRWVALRGALAEIFISVLDAESRAVSVSELEGAMGLEWVAGPNGQPHPDLAEPWKSRFPPEHHQAAMGIASSVVTRAEDYPRYSEMSVQDVNADPHCRRMGGSLALDTIAWSAVALLRLGVAQELFRQVPEPDALPEPGWYTEPLFGKAERYWDGSDWTAACRVRDGRQYIETHVPLA